MDGPGSNVPITPTSVVEAADRQVSADLDDEVLVLSLDSGEYHRLAGVAVRVWSLLGRPVRVAQVRDAILAEYEVEAERCERDLLRLLERLRERGLVSLRPEDAGA